MSFTPNKQYTEGEDLSSNPTGPLVQTRDSVTSLAVPLTLGDEGNSPTVPVSGTGLLGRLRTISDQLGDSLNAGTVIDRLSALYSIILSTASPSYRRYSDISSSNTKGNLVFGQNDSLQAVPMSFDNDGNLRVARRDGLGNETPAGDDPSRAIFVTSPGAALDATVAAVTTSLGTDGATPPVIAGTGVRGFLRAIYDRLGAAIAVTGTFWQATQPISAAALPLPTGASTEATLAAIKAKTDNLDAALSSRTRPSDQQHVLIDSPTGLTDTQLRASAVPVTANAGTNLNTSLLALDTTVAAVTTSLGTDGATPPTIPGTGVRGWLRSCYDTLVLIKNIFPALLDMNSGNKSASTLRVVLATDQPTNTNKFAVTATSDQTSHGTTDLAADDIIKQAGVTLSAPVATAPDGSQTAPVVRGLNRKGTTIETTTPLAGNALFTGNWHDSNATGDNYVTAYSLSDKVGAAYVIEESDDTGNASFTRTVASWGGGPVANTLSMMIGVIRARWWRVKYTNGATLQTSFELTTCASSVAPDSILTNGTSGAGLGQMKQVAIYVPGGAGALTDNAALFQQLTSQNAAGGGPWDTLVRFHGGKFSGSASASKSGASAARTPTIFKQASTAASGDTALWTPASGNKFRILKFKVQFTADAATSGGARITVLLRDATVDIGLGHIVFVPSAGATALNAAYDSGWLDLGQFGYQATAANAVLNINLSAALSAGLCNVIVAGTEE